jgi:cysteine synthase
LEGPLHYRPHVVNPMGAIYSAEKDKFRTIHDATASGLNDMVLPDECNYDMLEDALPLQTEACWQAGWDLSNASSTNIGRSTTATCWGSTARASSTGSGTPPSVSQTARLSSSGSAPS